MTHLRGVASIAILSALALTLPLHAQLAPPQAPAAPPEDSTQVPSDLVHSSVAHPPIFHEVDLLHKSSFRTAQRATVTVQVYNKSGQVIPGLHFEDFLLTVNGTRRTGTLLGPTDNATPLVPLVMMVFPPNQPIVHSIAVTRAKQYFSSLPQELLPWRVAIFDSDGTLTSFTNGRTQLLAFLDVVEHKTEPMQYRTYLGLGGNFRWEGSWLTKAQQAITTMTFDDVPKVILAFNPIAGSIYGEVARVLALDGPESLVDSALNVGAHIYVANVGGPETLVPGGDASTGGAQYGAYIPQGQGQLAGLYVPQRFQQLNTLNYFAYRSSLVRQTAQDTMGGFSNSMKDLAGQIHHDLDNDYTLTFDLTPADREIGVPDVEIRMVDHNKRINLENLAAARPTPDHNANPGLNKDQMAAMWKTTSHPVVSPDFRIVQHVDFFPLRGGLQPVLPMSALVQWSGPGKPPDKLSVAEFVENTSLSNSVLQRDVEADWVGRGLSWERDGHLYPGQYVWRIVIHDDAGKVFASSDQKIKVDFPESPAVAISSIILGRSCRQQPGSDSMRRRADVKPADLDQAHFAIDPMRADDCRVKPEPTASFTQTDQLHAFLRIYPAGKLEKQAPDKWTASFTLRSATGAVELQRDLPFTIDSGSGYLASVNVPLNTPDIHEGPHTLAVQIRGPGIHKQFSDSRQLTLLPATHP